MSFSIKLGLKELEKFDTENLLGVFIHPGDIPLLNFDILSEFFDYPINKNDLIIVPKYNNKKGHPVFIGKVLLKEIDSISDVNYGLKGFLQNLSSKINYLEVNSAILTRSSFLIP